MPITYYHDAPIQMPLDLARRAGQYAGQAEIGKEMRARQAQQQSQIQEMAFREEQAAFDRQLQVQKMQQDALSRQQQMDFQKEMAQQQQEASLNQMMVASDFERAQMLSKDKAKKESLGYTYTQEDTKRMADLKNAIEKVRTSSNLTPLQRAQAMSGLQSELQSIMPSEAPYKGNLTDDQLYALETKGGYIVTDPTTGERTRYMKDGVGGIMEDDKFAQRETQVKIAEMQNKFKEQEAQRKEVESKNEEVRRQKESRQKSVQSRIDSYNKSESEFVRRELDLQKELMNRINDIEKAKSSATSIDPRADTSSYDQQIAETRKSYENRITDMQIRQQQFRKKSIQAQDEYDRMMYSDVQEQPMPGPRNPFEFGPGVSGTQQSAYEQATPMQGQLAQIVQQPQSEPPVPKTVEKWRKRIDETLKNAPEIGNSLKEYKAAQDRERAARSKKLFKDYQAEGINDLDLSMQVAG